ncbi:MAG: hypothetical protein ACYC9O_10130, partial [Candidatus Latescibacterota bacterium]
MKIQKKNIYGKMMPGIRETVPIGRSALELYELCRNPEVLSRALGRSISVETKSDNCLHWKVHGPAGILFHGNLALTLDEPGATLGWSVTGEHHRPFEILLKFRPAPGDWGTETSLSAYYDPP